MRRLLDPWYIYGVVLSVFLLTPILLVVLFAFTSRGLANFPIESLSMRWWGEMVQRPGFADALRNSLLVSGTVAVGAAVLGTLASLGIAKLSPRHRGIVITTLSLPVVTPPLVLAVAMLVAFTSSGFGLGLHAVIAAHLLLTVPFVIAIMSARTANLDPALVECARDLGSTPFVAFRTVLLPLLAPSIVGSALVSFALSVDDYVLTSFTIGTGNTLPTFVWSMIRTSASPLVNAIGTLLIAFSMGATLLALKLTRYRG